MILAELERLPSESSSLAPSVVHIGIAVDTQVGLVGTGLVVELGLAVLLL